MCRQLGLPEVSQVYTGAAFGQGNGSIIKDRYFCQGTENSILDCLQTGSNPYCSHWADAGIACGPLVSSGT